MAIFANIFHYLAGLGFFETILPFLIIFSFTYGILDYSKLFETDKYGKKFTTMISLLFSLFFIFSEPRVKFLNKIALITIIAIIFMFFLKLILLNVFPNLEKIEKELAIALVIFGIFLASQFIKFNNGELKGFFVWLVQYVAVIGSLIFVVYFVTKGRDSSDSLSFKNKQLTEKSNKKEKNKLKEKSENIKIPHSSTQNIIPTNYETTYDTPLARFTTEDLKKLKDDEYLWKEQH